MALSRSVLALALAALSGLCPVVPFAAADDCQPSTWAAQDDIHVLGAATSPPGPKITRHAESKNPKNVGPGDVNCRFWVPTGEDVNYYTCTELAEKYEITVEKFFELNPDVKDDCSNLKPNTEYCLDGCENPTPVLGPWETKLMYVQSSNPLSMTMGPAAQSMETAPAELRASRAVTRRPGCAAIRCKTFSLIELPTNSRLRTDPGAARIVRMASATRAPAQVIKRTPLTAPAGTRTATASAPASGGTAATLTASAGRARITVARTNASLATARSPLAPQARLAWSWLNTLRTEGSDRLSQVTTCCLIRKGRHEEGRAVVGSRVKFTCMLVVA